MGSISTEGRVVVAIAGRAASCDGAGDAICSADGDALPAVGKLRVKQRKTGSAGLVPIRSLRPSMAEGRVLPGPRRKWHAYTVENAHELLLGLCGEMGGRPLFDGLNDWVN